MTIRIDCASFSGIADDLSRNALSDEEAISALEHVKACPPCAQRLEQARILGEALRGAEAACRPREAPAAVEQALRNRFRQQRNLIRWRRRRQRWIAGGIAAGIILVAGVSVRMARLAHAPRERAPAMQMQRPAVRPAAPARVTGPSPEIEAENAQPEEMTGFTPLPYAEGAPPVNEEQVVRVSVPAAALSEIGLPVAAQQSSQYVTADIILGDDGIARAIRIVQ